MYYTDIAIVFKSPKNANLMTNKKISNISMVVQVTLVAPILSHPEVFGFTPIRKKLQTSLLNCLM